MFDGLDSKPSNIRVNFSSLANCFKKEISCSFVLFKSDFRTNSIKSFFKFSLKFVPERVFLQVFRIILTKKLSDVEFCVKLSNIKDLPIPGSADMTKTLSLFIWKSSFSSIDSLVSIIRSILCVTSI
jgi:hypothetical protein